MENFLEFCSNIKIMNLMDVYNLFTSNNEDLERLHFNLMDSRQKGAVAWCDFALFYSSKLIAAKNKVRKFYLDNIIYLFIYF
jgi:hypothetical protein